METLKPPTEHLITPATLMTISRPLIGLDISRRLIQGDTDSPLLPRLLVMGASDAEGNMARFIDRVFPDSGYGTTEHGKRLDPVADCVTLAEVALSALKAPRVSMLGKAALGIVSLSETVKATWAARAWLEHRQAGEDIVDVHKFGKQATALKFMAVASAVTTHDMEAGPARTGMGILALGSAIVGIVQGERARSIYKRALAAEA